MHDLNYRFARNILFIVYHIIYFNNRTARNTDFIENITDLSRITACNERRNHTHNLIDVLHSKRICCIVGVVPELSASHHFSAPLPGLLCACNQHNKFIVFRRQRCNRTGNAVIHRRACVDRPVKPVFRYMSLLHKDRSGRIRICDKAQPCG